jgi:leucyl-tRNA synthetase
MFGPDLEGYAPPDINDPPPPAAPAAPGAPPQDAVKVDKAKKGKIAAKSTGHVYQFQIMEAMGVPRAEIKKFADPMHWLTYFPPIAMVRIYFIRPDEMG